MENVIYSIKVNLAELTTEADDDIEEVTLDVEEEEEIQENYTLALQTEVKNSWIGSISSYSWSREVPQL